MAMLLVPEKTAKRAQENKILFFLFSSVRKVFKKKPKLALSEVTKVS